jgi:hypothetical protein
MNYGKIAYEAYCKSRNWKSIRGEPLPQFEAQAPEIQKAWQEAGQAVAEQIRIASGPG